MADLAGRLWAATHPDALPLAQQNIAIQQEYRLLSDTAVAVLAEAGGDLKALGRVALDAASRAGDDDCSQAATYVRIAQAVSACAVAAVREAEVRPLRQRLHAAVKRGDDLRAERDGLVAQMAGLRKALGDATEVLKSLHPQEALDEYSGVHQVRKRGMAALGADPGAAVRRVEALEHVAGEARVVAGRIVHADVRPSDSVVVELLRALGELHAIDETMR